MKINSILSICAALFLMSSCDRNDIEFLETRDVSGQALIKFNNVSLYANNRLMVLKVNDQRVSNPITARTPFPGGGYNTGGDSRPDFIGVNPGDVKVSVVVPYKIDSGLDSLTLYTTNVKLEAGKNYVLHITDTAANTKSVLTEENFAMPDSGIARYRFTNLMPNVPAIDLYYGSSATVTTADTLVTSNIAYMSTSAEFKLKSGQTGRHWKIRPAGAAKTSTPIATYTSNSTFTNQRVYSIFACGYTGFVSPNTRRPFVSFFLIR